MRNCRSRSACGSGSVLQPRAWRAQRRQTACSRWRSALPWVKLMATGRRPSPSRVASEAHFPWLACWSVRDQLSWLDQDDGRIRPGPLVRPGQRDRDPTVGPCNCHGSVTICPLLILLLTTLSCSPSVGQWRSGRSHPAGQVLHGGLSAGDRLEIRKPVPCRGRYRVPGAGTRLPGAPRCRLHFLR
jgi:hypothetical protein